MSTVIGIATLVAVTATSMAAPTFKKVVLSRQKFHIPGSSVHFGSFGQPALNDKGDVVFFSTIYGPTINSSNNSAIFKRVNGKIKLVVQERTATLVSGFTYFLDSITSNPLINKKSLVYWSGTYQTPELDYNTLYSFNNKSNASYGFLEIGGTTPGSEPIADFNSKTNLSVLALWTALDTDPLTVVRASPASAVGLVSAGDTAIGLPLGSTFTTFGAPTLDENNAVYFVANVSNTGAAFDGVWYGKNGDPDPLVILNDAAPGANGNKFTTFVDSPSPAPKGKLCAFSATAGDVSGIWITEVPAGKVTLMAANGDSISGMPGAKLASIQPPATNDAGTVAFLATPNIGTVAALGLFIAKTPGNVQKVVAVGDSVDIRGTSAKVIDLRFTQLGGINKSGKLVCTLSFDNRTSGVFIITP